MLGRSHGIHEANGFGVPLNSGLKKRVIFVPPHSIEKRGLSMRVLEAGMVDVRWDARKK